LETLGQYVGDWTTEVTSKPAVWTPQEVRYQTSNHAEFVMNGWFLQHIEVSREVSDPSKVGKAFFVWSYDPGEKKYVGWAFHSSGVISHVTGAWDATSKAFVSSETEPPPGTTMTLMEAFSNNSTINGSLVFTGNDRRTMFDMVWTRTRQAGIVGKPLAEQWAEIGTPIQPIPDEVKKLEMFVGTRDVEFIQRHSLIVPQGSTAKGTMSGRWILDGRFLMGETTLPTFQSQWVIGYDTNKRAFRYVLFGSNGRIDESIGLWNEADRVFDWKLVNGPPELTRTSTTRRLDGGRVESHILAKTQDGQTQMDLTIKATPRQ
jgi:hypothetical protein